MHIQLTTRQEIYFSRKQYSKLNGAVEKVPQNYSLSKWG